MPSKGIVYYTDSKLDPIIFKACRTQLKRALDAQPSFFQVVSVSLGPELTDFGRGISLDMERGYLSMFKQILTGLEALDTDIAFLVEHDMLMHQSHFTFTPPDRDHYFYNQHVYKVSSTSGHALHYPCSQTSGLVANRELLRAHYAERVRRVESEGFTRKMGFEPGTHHRPERIDDMQSSTWMSDIPNIDIRHTTNLTESRWSKDEFRNAKYTEGWTESSEVPGWGVTEGRFDQFLQELAHEN